MRAVLEPADLRRYDELNDPQGAMRAHWRPLIDRLRADESPDAVRRSLELTRRLIVENGVTYNVYADPQGADRPWALDPLPFVLPAAEWQTIEAGVAQRARLLNALLADLYGPQRLLAEGHIPAELPFGHPNYLWPCHGLRPADGTLAARLRRRSGARAGRPLVAAGRPHAGAFGRGLRARESRDPRAGAPGGHSPTWRCAACAASSAHLRERMLPTRAAGDEAPLAVILTPGPYNETYFEHAYLARQLGMPLVEGHDLTVRGDTVFLKTLGGLRRVHSILRRLDDDFCDPLELRGDSALGVPGLIGALRAGRVMVSNALGTGVLESAAWLGFLPPIAERLIGEKLLLPGSRHVVAAARSPRSNTCSRNLDRLVIKPAYPNQRFEPMFGRDFEGKARDAADRAPAQPALRLRRAGARAPVAGAGVEIRGVARARRARAHDPRLRGGHARRRSRDARRPRARRQRSGGRRGLHAARRRRQGHLGARRRRARRDASTYGRSRASGRSLQRQDYIPSRLVENLYWLGPLHGALRKHGAAAAAHARPRAATRASGRMRGRSAATSARSSRGRRGRSTRCATRDSQGLQADVKHLAWCASQVRNRLSARYWRGVVGLQRQMQEAVGDARQQPRSLRTRAAVARGAHRILRRRHDARRGLARDAPRPAHRAHAVRGRHPRAAARKRQATRPETVEWLLDVCDSTPIYRARYLGAPRLSPMLNLLLYDDGHPMALAFHRRSIDRDLDDLARSLGGERERGVPDVPLLPQGSAELLDASGEAGDAARAALAPSSPRSRRGTGELSDRLSRRYFALIDSDAQALAT